MSRETTPRNGNGHSRDAIFPANLPISQVDSSRPLPPSVATRLARGKLNVIISFAGQGNGWLDELAQLNAESDAAAQLIDAASQSIATLLADRRLRWSGRYEQGFDLDDWIADTDARPSSAYLASSCISMPLIFLTQMARFVALAEEGLVDAFEAGVVQALTGHSQGVMAALLVSESAGKVQTERFGEYFRIMVWQGFLMDESSPCTPMGAATAMAAVSGLEHAELQAYLDKLNHSLEIPLVIALQNTFNRHVVSGLPTSLERLHAILEQQSTREAERRKAGRFGGRPLSFTWEYLPVSAPFHSPAMQAGRVEMTATMAEYGFSIDAAALSVPVIDPADSTTFNADPHPEVRVMDSQFLAPVRWCDALQHIGSTLRPDMIIDAGPGDGVAKLTGACLRGYGIEVIPAATTGGRRRLFTRGAQQDRPTVDYREFAPRTVRLPDGTAALDNLFTRATGSQPVILPGMTPTTVDAPIVAAAANAGFVAELAGGGQVTEHIFQLRVEELKTLLKPGREVVFNALYLDPYLWDLHFKKAIVQKARRAGAPICGVTVSAGIPPLEEAIALLDEFVDCGLWLNAFKPGTVAQVEQVIKIAKATDHTIHLHLEGGLAGGHHSWESLDQLLLATYHRIRSVSNIVLCVGGGIADEARASELLHGTWSQRFGRPIMPVDAVFLGTVAMAALEATTSASVKDTLVNASGTDEWVYRGASTGGLTSGMSQLNADIHYVDNAAARCGKLLDAVAGDAEAVAQQRDQIVAALNQTAKPYFGDLETMTYGQVIERLFGLMAIGRNGRYEDGVWLDRSWRQRAADLVQRAEARLSTQTDGTIDSIITGLDSLDAPDVVVSQFTKRYADLDQPLHPADVDWFINGLCARPGKPVNFVPVINADVRRWYKSDSLWQAHDERYTADQVLVIPGPAATRGITRADEPVGDLLQRFAQAATTQNIQEATASEWLFGPPQTVASELPTGFTSTIEHGVLHLEPATVFGADTPSVDWFDWAASRFHGPLAAFFRAQRVLVGDRTTVNPLRQLAFSTPGARLSLHSEDDRLVKASYRPTADAADALTMALSDTGIQFDLQVSGAEGPATLQLNFALQSGHDTPRFSTQAADYDDAVRSFYLAALFGQPLAHVPLFDEASAEVTVDALEVRGYASLTGTPREIAAVPTNFAFSLVWQSLFKVLAEPELAEGLLRLVHLRNAVIAGPGWPMQSGESLTARSRLTRIEDSGRGRTVAVTSSLWRGTTQVAEVQSGFFIRGDYGQTPFALRATEKHTWTLRTGDVAETSWLTAHPWLTLRDGASLSAGDCIVVDAATETFVSRNPSVESRFAALGTVSTGDNIVADIELSTADTLETHPVVAAFSLLEDASATAKPVSARTLATLTTSAPRSMDDFAAVSGDANPIHRSDLAARLAHLPEPIVHGMWTAARLHAFVVQHVCNGKPERIVSYDASFLAPVMRGAQLSLAAVRREVLGGKLVIEATATITASGQPAVRATIELAAPATAYIFPGQGIQQADMGMAGYQRSAAARAIWERADALTRNKLGFSILDIVRKNPREIVVDGRTYTHPRGVLNLTQFTQVSMAVLASAQVAEMREQGVFVEGAMTCGHSVGEYNALAAVTGVMSLEAVIALVYQRGLAMHRLVPRDADGISGFGMGVIRPHYAGLDHAGAEALVARIGADTGQFIQIVNYNIKGRQYSVTGDLAALQALSKALTDLAPNATKPPLILVPGIDVPFHSKVLFDGVPAFRKVLGEQLPPESDYLSLQGRYIPNLVARPFALTRDFVQAMFEATQSPEIQAILDGFDTLRESPNTLGRTLLIELLAWQFASPVRWIETQDVLLTVADSRIVEVGVGYQPTLANMMRATLTGVPQASAEVLNVEAEADAVFFLDADPESAPEPDTDESDDAPSSAGAPSDAPAAAPVVAAPVANAGPAPTDAPMTHIDGLRAILALQAKLRPEQLAASETIDEVFEGVSSRRNQVLMDLGAEFGVGAIDGAHEKSLTDLAAELASRAGRWKAPGGYLRGAEDELLRKALSRAGVVRKDIATYLTESFAFGEGLVSRTTHRLALELREGDSSRGGQLGQLADAPPANKAAALLLIDAAAAMVAQDAGFALSKAGGAAEGGAAVDAAVVRELHTEILGEAGVLMQASRDLAERLGHLERPTHAFQAAPNTTLEDELGKEFERFVTPSFDALKHVQLDSNWASARRDVASLYLDGINGRISDADIQTAASRLAIFADDRSVQKTAAWYADKAERSGHTALAAALVTLQRGASKTPWQVTPTRPNLDIARGELHYHESAEGTLNAWIDGCFSGALPIHVGHGRYGADGALDATMKSVLEAGSTEAFDFAGRTALVNGASPGSIAIEVVRHLLRGGARVIVTTTTTSMARMAFYRSVYQQSSAPGAELHVVPFNQGSTQDVAQLVEWLYSEVTEQSGATVKVIKRPFDVDIIVPFGAIKDLATADQLGARADAALRVMLLGVERLVAAIAGRRMALGPAARKVHVLLPLSPNHGAFGGDGAYAETKAALETLLQKWRSERDAWAAGATLAGARIGWVRGTGLMDANNPMSARLEASGKMLTFSSAEMGFLLAALCTPTMAAAAQAQPVQADLTRGFDAIDDLKGFVDGIRKDLEAEAGLQRKTHHLEKTYAQTLRHDKPADPVHALPGWPNATIHTQPTDVAWPGRVTASMDDTVVIVGIGEVGPCGSSRTRYQIEVDDTLSAAGVLELAWVTGLVTWEEGARGGGQWIDTESKEPVAEYALASKYAEQVREHSGVRFVDPATAGFDVEASRVLATAYLDRDFTFTVANEGEARSFLDADPEHTRVAYDGDSDVWTVTRLAGTEVRVPRQAKLSRRAAGVIPTHFDFARLGIPPDMLESVDRVTLFNIVATVDAFLSAGLTPEELMSRVHPTRVANTQGSGMGGMHSLRRMYVDHLLGEERQSDILQESLINVMAGYIVQGFVGSYGAMMHPVGACATAALSMEEAYDKILAGRADFVVAGAYDDLSAEGMIGFGDMNATADTDEMLARGIDPRGMSRSNDRRRRGFVEAQGGGTTLLARASVARDLGLPVYGVMAWGGSYSDGIHKSIPAPGLGVLASAAGGAVSPLGRALERFGLDTNDIAVVYKHDTSTAANDPNENNLHNRIQNELGRTEGNPLFVVSQKALTGHAKGGAAAWQVAGLCQALNAGAIAGNRNLESVDPAMRKFEHMMFSDQTLYAGKERLNAGLVTSLGFGHVGSIVMILHPDAFLEMLGDDERAAYLERSSNRRQSESRQRARILLGQRKAWSRRGERRFDAADGTDAQAEQEAAMLLDPDARLDPQTGQYSGTTGGHG